MSQKALFPGSFDPFTKGHEAIVQKALTMFDQVVIGIGYNTSKNSYFDLEKRLQHVKSIYAQQPNVEVLKYSKLTIDFALENNIHHVIRGLRDGKDFDYEKSIALMNKELEPKVETVFLLTDNQYSAINSTIVREIHKHGGNISLFVSKVELL